jgi:hypothetical protein
MGLNLVGGLKGLSAGLGTMANLKLGQEAEQADLLKQQNLSRFRSDLAEEKAIAAEGRAFERTGSGLFDPNDPTRELTRLEAKDRTGLLTGVQSQEKITEAAGVTKRKVAKADRVDGIMTAYPEMSERQAKKADSIIQKKKLVGGKPIPATVKADTYDKSRVAVAETVDVSDPMFEKKVKAEYDKRIAAITPDKLDLEGAVADKPTVTTVPQAPPQAVKEAEMSGNPGQWGEQEKLNARNLSGATPEQLKIIEAKIDDAVDQANKIIRGRKPPSLAEPSLLDPVPGPARGTSTITGRGLL